MLGGNDNDDKHIYAGLKRLEHKIEERLNPTNLNSFSSIIHVTFAELELVKQAAELINNSGREYQTSKLSTDEELVVKFRSEIKQLVETIKAKIAADRDKLEKLGHAPEHTQIDWDYKSPALTGRMDALEEVLDLLEVFVVL